MKTINELGIYFMCCFIFATLFITYLSVKLRAYRIKNAGLTNRIEIADKDVSDAYDAVERVKLDMSFHRTESADIINQSAENNAKLVLEIGELKNELASKAVFHKMKQRQLKDFFERNTLANIRSIKESYQNNEEALKLFYETQIETLKADRQKLFDIAKGATAKLAEINIALEGLEIEEKDWSKEAFPLGYIVPLNTEVVSLINYHNVKVGERGIKIFHGITYRFFSDTHTPSCMFNYEIAPFNPLDHPNHPNFRG